MTENRLDTLEEAVAHLTRLTEDLSDVIAHQDAEIALLNRRVATLMDREATREAEASNTIPLADQKPPHW